MEPWPVRVLLDTNIWISALISPNGMPARVLRLFLGQRIVPVLCSALLDELVDVLSRPRIRGRIHLPEHEIIEILALIADRSVETFPTGQVRLCRDPDDDIVLEAALLGKAQFLITRDDDMKRDRDLMVHLEERGVQVVSVSQFLALIESIE